MRTSIWKPSQMMFGKHLCIELTQRNRFGELETEYALAGRRGDIWKYGPGVYRAIVIRGKTGKLHANEQLVRFGEEELDRWVVELQVPADPVEQTPYANTFGRTG